MKIGLTGGTGFVGQTLIDLALAEGHEIAALARREQEARDGVEWVLGDLSDKSALERLASETEAVIHVAGVVNARDMDGFEHGNVGGTKNVIEAATKAGASRLVYVSSLSAREPTISAYGASKHRAEKHVQESELGWTIVRPPAIYGPRDTQMLDLFKAAKWGFVPTPKEGKVSVIHVEDLARLLLGLLPGGRHVTHRSFEPDDGKRGGWSHDELAQAIGWAVGRQPRVLGLSRRAIELGARIDMAVRRGRAKLTLDRASYFCHPDWVVSHGSRVPYEIWHPRIETHEGLKATAQWYREQGWL